MRLKKIKKYFTYNLGKFSKLLITERVQSKGDEEKNNVGWGLWITVAQLVECYTGDQRIASLRLTSHCVVSLSKTLYSLLSTGSTQEDPSRLG